MNNAVDAKRLMTGRVRLSYVHLTQPRQQDTGKAKYGVTLLIPKSDVVTKQKIDAAIQAAIAEGVTSKWGGTRPAQPALPIHDGDGLRPTGEPFGEECKGCWVMTASSEHKPEVVDLGLNLIIDATQIYSGMYGRATIRMFPYMASGKKGIGCGLGNVQKLEDGEPLGGRTSATSDFADNNNFNSLQQTAPGYAPAPAPTYYAPAPAPGYPTAQQPDPITGQAPIGGIYGV